MTTVNVRVFSQNKIVLCSKCIHESASFFVVPRNKASEAKNCIRVAMVD
jgi:hypothetical protein